MVNNINKKILVSLIHLKKSVLLIGIVLLLIVQYASGDKPLPNEEDICNYLSKLLHDYQIFVESYVDKEFRDDEYFCLYSDLSLSHAFKVYFLKGSIDSNETIVFIFEPIFSVKDIYINNLEYHFSDLFR